jgi:MFS family permease
MGQGVATVAIADRAAGRRALLGAWVGWFVDMFDVYLPIIALGPAMSYFEPASLSPAFKVTLYYIVFSLSLVGRPVGSFVFGHFGDKIGRRKVTIVAMGGFGFVTLLIALLPGYKTWGIASIILLIFLRFVDGVFLGGEYSGANPLAMEYAPKEKRGAWAAAIHTGFPLALVAISLLVTGLLREIPAGAPDSPYVIWGWRIPFVVGAIAAVGILLYYVKKVPESKIWAMAQKTSSPLKELFQGKNLRILLQVFLVMSGAWFTLNAVTSILPGVLLSVKHVNSIIVTDAQFVANLVMALSFIPFGILGQKIGRKTILMLIGVAGFTVGPALYYLLVNRGFHSTLELMVLVVLINFCATPVWAIVTSYINERFPTGVRSSGYGIGYSAATIIPAFSSFYMLGLRGLGMPYQYTQIVILAVGGFLLMAGALSGPETKHVDLTVGS